MKKILLFFFVILLLFIGGIAVFVLTFDVNHYKPQITQMIKEHTNADVQMGDIQIHWGMEPEFNIQNIQVGDLSLDEANVALRFKPLLEKRLEISSIVLINPKINIVKDSSGRVQIRGLEGKSKPPVETTDSSPESVNATNRLSKTQIDYLKIQNGGIYYVDASTNPPSSMTIAPIHVELQDLVFSDHLERVKIKANSDLISLPQLKNPIENVVIEFEIIGDELVLDSFDADFAGGHLVSSGNSKHFLSQYPETQLTLNLQKLKIEEFQQSPNPYKPQLHGNFSAAFNGKTQGMAWPVISQTLTGNGEVALSEAYVSNINLLSMVLGQLSRVPGVKDFLDVNLPQQYRDVLSRKETHIEPIKYPVNLSQGNLYFQNLRIASPGFEIYGTGQAHLNGNVNCIATLALDPQLSAMLIQGVPNLQLAADQFGRLSIPIRIFGHVNQLVIQPDIDHLISKVIQSAGQELLGSALQYL